MLLSYPKEQWKRVVLGSLLGDGSIAINKRYKNARFSFRHSIKQRDYFEWKVLMLKPISGEKHSWEQNEIQEKSSFGGAKLRYQSKTLDELTKIHQLVTKKGKKRVSRKWLNKLSPLSLAVWWLDDGSLISHSRKGVICTDSFTKEEVKLIQRYFKVVWDIKTAIGTVNKKDKTYYRLYFRSTNELMKFLRIILPHIQVESMLYKVLVLYKDSQLQQRWISEVSDLTMFSQNVVQKHVQQRKNQLKHYYTDTSEKDIVRSSQ